MEKTNHITVNEIPSKTWSWLKMNRAAVDVPSALEPVLPKVRGICEGVSYSEKPSSKEMPDAAYTGGCGSSFDALFDGVQTVLITAASASGVSSGAENAPVVLDYRLSGGKSAVAAQDVFARENSSVTVIIVSSSDKGAGGFQALRTKLYAARNAKIHLVKVQLLGAGFVQADETAGFCEENASIEVTHIILGGAQTYLGAGANLSGYKSAFRSDAAYLCGNGQVLDMNYVVLQYGKKSDCQMFVNGTLRGNGRKTYRGTIDFKNGCSGSTGNEQEETLVLSPQAVNNSIPVILCDEEDVSGEHGATIGRLGDDVLFYMQSRGIPKESAENIIARAKVQALLGKITDDVTVSAVSDFMNGLFGED